MKKIAGIDGSKGGWVCVSGYENNYKELKFEKLKEFNDIKSKNFNLVLVDIPIGLDIDLKKGGRIVDKLARKELLTNKSSIFNAPSRLVLDAKNYEEANRINKSKGMGLSKQSWNLVKKIKSGYKRSTGSSDVSRIYLDATNKFETFFNSKVNIKENSSGKVSLNAIFENIDELYKILKKISN